MSTVCRSCNSNHFPLPCHISKPLSHNNSHTSTHIACTLHMAHCLLACLICGKAQIPLYWLPPNFPMTRVTGKFRGSQRLVMEKSPSRIMLRGKSRGCVEVTNHCDMSRWFEKFPRQVVNQLVCIMETGKSAASTTRHREVGDVVNKSTGMSWTSRGSRHSGIWA